ncbi:MAG: DNA polymerase IV [Acidimicrobiia bacterium]|nr:DNA polymerase IV [Acidimicrobiia bacterium]
MFSEPILHVDMDAFYVEVERLDDASLSGVPVIVGGLGNRGVVAAASYEARQYGVFSAMPMAQARKLCRHARYVPPRMSRYSEVSESVFEIFRSVTPAVEGLSVDEAFLDVSSLRLLYQDSVEVAVEVRRRIREELDLPASVGVAPTKLVAKLASEDAKPDGLLHVPSSHLLEYLQALPVRRLWGVGEATHAMLEGFGVETIGDIAAMTPATLASRLGKAAATHLHELASGRDPRSVVSNDGAKSISVEATYESDLHDLAKIDREILAHCERLAQRLRKAGYAAKTVTLKVRLGDFTTVTRSHSLPSPIDVTRDLWSIARELYSRIDLQSQGIRLLGIGAASLVAKGTPRQMALDGSRHQALAAATDRVRDRYGSDAVGPAALADAPEPERPIS